MSYCHVSAQADLHAEEYGQQQFHAEAMQEEFGKRMADPEYVIEGLRNFLEREERIMSVALQTGDLCQLGTLVDIAVRRHVWERVEDDLGDGS